MPVKFIVDSASDILPSEAAEWGVVLLPLKVVFGEREYADAVDLTHAQFYEKLIESDVLPTTCQIPPSEFEEAYRSLGEDDTAVVITLSSKLSGTYQSAVLAAQEHAGRIYVVDSESVCIGERILVQRGMELAAEGLSAEEIADKLNTEKKKIRLLALLDTLEYLKKGGRISAAAAAFGSVLSIKPVITLKDGEIEVLGKARGSKQGNNLLRELVGKNGGIDFKKPFCLAYSGLSKMLLLKYIDDSYEIWSDHVEKLPVATVGCTIGTHAGPGAIAVAFFER